MSMQEELRSALEKIEVRASSWLNAGRSTVDAGRGMDVAVRLVETIASVARAALAAAPALAILPSDAWDRVLIQRPTIRVHADGGFVWTECPDCGADVKVDEDGCCAMCGVESVRYGAAVPAPNEAATEACDIAMRLREWLADLDDDFRTDAHVFEEAYVGAGYCGCRVCQIEIPLLDAAASTLTAMAGIVRSQDRRLSRERVLDSARSNEPLRERIAAVLAGLDAGPANTTAIAAALYDIRRAVAVPADTPRAEPMNEDRAMSDEMSIERQVEILESVGAHDEAARLRQRAERSNGIMRSFANEKGVVDVGSLLDTYGYKQQAPGVYSAPRAEPTQPLREVLDLLRKARAFLGVRLSSCRFYCVRCGPGLGYVLAMSPCPAPCDAASVGYLTGFLLSRCGLSRNDLLRKARAFLPLPDERHPYRHSPGYQKRYDLAAEIDAALASHERWRGDSPSHEGSAPVAVR